MYKSLIIAGTGLALMAGPAQAQTPAVGNGYGGQGSVVPTVTEGTGVQGTGAQGTEASGVKSVSAARPASVDNDSEASSQGGQGSLPFTGFDIGLLLMGGIALLAVGLTLRRGSRPPAA